MRKIAMQTRCVHCGFEQYGPAVWAISHGNHPCCWCGKKSDEMTEAEYYSKIVALRKNNGKKTPANSKG